MSVDFYPVHPETQRPIADAPRCNFANENARTLINAIGLTYDSSGFGEIRPADVSIALRLCETALGNDAHGLVQRSGMVRETITEGRHVINGSSDGRARERLAELREVLRWAVKHNAGVSWS